MLQAMRITIRMDRRLLAKAKKAAAARGLTLAGLVEESLREAMIRQGRSVGRSKFRLPTYDKGGLLPGVNLDNSAEHVDLMEGRIDRD